MKHLFKSVFYHINNIAEYNITSHQQTQQIQMDTDTSVPTIEALNKSFPGSIPDLFSHFFRINFVKFLYIVQTDTELMFTVQKLRPEWGKGAISSGWSGDHP